MAVDFLVLPLSRVLAGAYATPEMQQAWAAGHSARLESPDGDVVERAPGILLGGEDAQARATQWRDAMDAYRASLPYDIGEIPWHEDDEGAGVVDTVPHSAWGALVFQCRKIHEKRGGILARLLSDRKSTASHLANGAVFVDAAFVRPFQKGELVFSSLSGALVELDTLPANDDVALAANAFRKAAAAARDHRLPLFVDA